MRILEELVILALLILQKYLVITHSSVAGALSILFRSLLLAPLARWRVRFNRSSMSTTTVLVVEELLTGAPPEQQVPLPEPQPPPPDPAPPLAAPFDLLVGSPAAVGIISSSSDEDE